MALAIGGALAGCASAEQTGTPAHRLKVWESGTSYHSEYATVLADVARIDAARAAGDNPAVVEFDCVTLGQDVSKDYIQLPTPDQAMSNDLSEADVAYLSYANSCVDHKGAPATMAAINHYLIAGNQAMAAAKARSRQVLG
jgi:hypothetical protein